MVLLVVGFAGGGTPGHLLMGGGVYKKYCLHFTMYSIDAMLMSGQDLVTDI